MFSQANTESSSWTYTVGLLLNQHDTCLQKQRTECTYTLSYLGNRSVYTSTKYVLNQYYICLEKQLLITV